MKTNLFHPGFLLGLFLMLAFGAASAHKNALDSPIAAPAKPSAIGELHLHQFKSRIFGNTRTIRILLPHGYDQRSNRETRYSVLYLQDGQNLFDAATSVFNRLEWEVDEAVATLIADQAIEPLIVVGIDSAGRRMRANEYLPYPDAYLTPPLPNPQGSRYPDFLLQEVIPFVNQRYRTRTDAEHTGIGGSSYGALISLYTVITRPGVFGRLLLESPSLYVSNGRIIKESQDVREWPGKIYLGVGTNEGGRADCRPGDMNHEAVQDVLKLVHVLESDGVSKRRVKVAVAECAVHDESAWAGRLPSALEYLYGRP